MLQLRARGFGTLTREPMTTHHAAYQLFCRHPMRELEGIPHSVDSPIGLPSVELPVRFYASWAVNALFGGLRLMFARCFELRPLRRRAASD
jgi:hypothetical protein